MRPIIIATDFSDVANNATQYACNLAVQFNCPVNIIHAYSIPVTFHENPMPVISLEEGKNMAASQMHNLTGDLRQQYSQLSISSSIVYGDITDSLKEAVAEQNPWLVVVGNSSSDDAGFWLGSNLLSTLRNISCPVLAVPAAYTYERVEKIAFACDFKNVTEWLPANDLVKLIANTGAELHVINVNHTHRSPDDMSVEHSYMNEAIGSANPQYHYIEQEDIDTALQSFVTVNNVDWLIVIPHKHGFFESLFHKSQTKAIVRHAHIPILALHEKG